MSRWGRGGMVGVGKAIHQHEHTVRQASVILDNEHGTGHEPGTRPDLCPKCQTKDEIAETIQRVRELDKAATKGPWTAQASGDPDSPGEWLARFPNGEDASVLSATDARLVSEYRTAAPLLADECERLRARVARVAKLEAVVEASRGLLRMWPHSDDDARCEPAAKAYRRALRALDDSGGSGAAQADEKGTVVVGGKPVRPKDPQAATPVEAVRSAPPEPAGSRYQSCECEKPCPFHETTPKMREALRALLELDPVQRGRLLCWFCSDCYERIPPGEQHECKICQTPSPVPNPEEIG